jgi:peptide/nickel transport system permease protein
VHCRFLLIVLLITFAMILLIPGDPAVVIAVLSATPAQIANIRHDLGPNQPLLTQLGRWYVGLLLITLLIGSGIIAALRQNTWID